MFRLRCLIFAGCVVVLAAAPAEAQISFTTAVDLALRNSPRVKVAQADVERLRAALDEAKDVYIPTLIAGSGLGYSYGFPLGQPSVVNVTSQSLLLSYSQPDYIRAARASLTAANLALKDVRQAVAEDAALTYIALTRDQQKEAALNDENGYAAKLTTIVQDRLGAGQDTPIDLTTAKLTLAQIRLARLQAEDDTSADQEHLARLTGLPASGLTVVPSSIPAPAAASLGKDTEAPLSPAVESSYAVAKAKQQIAFGDSRYVWRPQIYFSAQYSLFAKFNNYQTYYNAAAFQYNNAGIGVQITFPIFDYVHKAKARESAAEAARAWHESEAARDQFLEGRKKATRVVSELAARSEVASLNQQLAQQQLDMLLVQLKSGTGNAGGPQMSPKDEQNSRIAERERFIGVLDAECQMRQAQISLMRQTGQLETWLKSVAGSQEVDVAHLQ